MSTPSGVVTMQLPLNYIGYVFSYSFISCSVPYYIMAHVPLFQNCNENDSINLIQKCFHPDQVLFFSQRFLRSFTTLLFLSCQVLSNKDKSGVLWCFWNETKTIYLFFYTHPQFYIFPVAMEEEPTDLPGTDGLAPKQRHQAKHRELFLSRHVETLPATHIRGKCTVTLLNETESLLSYLNKDVSMYRPRKTYTPIRSPSGPWMPYCLPGDSYSGLVLGWPCR